MLYLLNTPVLTAYGEWKFIGPVSHEEINVLLQQPFISAIGHAGAAEFLSTLFEKEIALNRISITMQPADQAIVLRFKNRFPEGTLLSKEDMRQLEVEFGLLTRLC